MQYVGQTALFSGTKAERKRAKDWDRSWVHHMVPLKDLVVSEEFMMFMDMFTCGFNTAIFFPTLPRSL